MSDRFLPVYISKFHYSNGNYASFNMNMSAQNWSISTLKHEPRIQPTRADQNPISLCSLIWEQNEKVQSVRELNWDASEKGAICRCSDSLMTICPRWAVKRDLTGALWPKQFALINHLGLQRCTFHIPTLGRQGTEPWACCLMLHFCNSINHQ